MDAFETRAQVSTMTRNTGVRVAEDYESFIELIWVSLLLHWLKLKKRCSTEEAVHAVEMGDGHPVNAWLRWAGSLYPATYNMKSRTGRSLSQIKRTSMHMVQSIPKFDRFAALWRQFMITARLAVILKSLERFSEFLRYRRGSPCPVAYHTSSIKIRFPNTLTTCCVNK